MLGYGKGATAPCTDSNQSQRAPSHSKGKSRCVRQFWAAAPQGNEVEWKVHFSYSWPLRLHSLAVHVYAKLFLGLPQNSPVRSHGSRAAALVLGPALAGSVDHVSPCLDVRRSRFVSTVTRCLLGSDDECGPWPVAAAPWPHRAVQIYRTIGR
jgi:hypothetical protein